MKINKITMGWIIASDAAKSAEFFTKTLGMTLTDCTPEYGWYELAGAEFTGAALGIGQQQPGHADKPGQNTVLALEVDNLDTAIEELHGKVTFVDKIMEVPGHVRMISFLDPDNNKFQLVQVLSGK